MSDAPERIWASEWKAARRGKHTMGGYTNSPIYPGSAEYVRADIHAAAIARAERAEAALAVTDRALAAIRDDMRMMMTGRTSLLQKTISTCDGTLAKIAALKGGAK